MASTETYLGDGLYASCDGYHIWLKASNGITVTAAVALEPAVFTALVAYEKKLRADSAARVANPERLQKRCEACCGTGRTDSGDDCYQRCDMCGGEGMLP